MSKKRKAKKLRKPSRHSTTEVPIIPGQRVSAEKAWDAWFAENVASEPVYWEYPRSNFLYIAERCDPGLWTHVLGLISTMRDHYGD